MNQAPPHAQSTPSRGASLGTLLAILFIGVAGAARAEVVQGEPLQIAGTLREAEDLSAVEWVFGRLAIASDEGASVQWLDGDPGGDDWRVAPDRVVLLAGEPEVDVEGLAADGDTLYVLGSHSRKRKKLKRNAAGAENLQRLRTVADERARQYIFRIRPGAQSGDAARVDSISLVERLESDSLLAPFTRIPGKENGIDLEGLAADGSTLAVGFRSPVLREGFVPVLFVDFLAPQRHQLRFVQLGGRGIRSLAKVRDGWLLLAGEEGEPGRFELFLWNGEDQIPDRGRAPGRLISLGELPTPGGGKPEGLTVVEESELTYVLIVVHDGIEGGALRRYRIPKTAANQSTK